MTKRRSAARLLLSELGHDLSRNDDVVERLCKLFEEGKNPF